MVWGDLRLSVSEGSYEWGGREGGKKERGREEREREGGGENIPFLLSFLMSCCPFYYNRQKYS